jgi:hypothetical protein
MSDILARLRDPMLWQLDEETEIMPLCHEAAAEIEQLRESKQSRRAGFQATSSGFNFKRTIRRKSLATDSGIGSPAAHRCPCRGDLPMNTPARSWDKPSFSIAARYCAAFIAWILGFLLGPDGDRSDRARAAWRLPGPALSVFPVAE